jgi:hypothetical protein
MALYLDVLAIVLLWAFPWGLPRSRLNVSSAIHSENTTPEQLIQRLIAQMKAGSTVQKTFSDQLDLTPDILDYAHILSRLTSRWAKESPSLVELLANCLSVAYQLSSQLGTNTVSLFQTILQRIEL